MLAAKRFLWQSSQGAKNQELRRQGLQPIGDRVQACLPRSSCFHVMHGSCQRAHTLCRASPALQQHCSHASLRMAMHGSDAGSLSMQSGQTLPGGRGGLASVPLVALS